MLYRLAFITAACVALTACSGSDESKKTEPAQAIAPVATTEAAKPAPAELSTATTPVQPAVEAVLDKAMIDPATCAYSVAELNQALGLDLSMVNAMEVPFAGGTQLSCLYTGEQPATVTVNKLLMEDPQMMQGMEEFLAGSLEPIPNDPDQAQWQTGDAGLSDLTLHYVRADNSVDIRLMGIDQAEWPVMKPKLIALRRIP
ncbi:MAG: hypothetical protein WBP46_12700 [Thiolinea sp.]